MNVQKEFRLLKTILYNIDRIRDVITKYNIDFNSYNADIRSGSHMLCEDIYVFDVCVFYMIRINSTTKKLSIKTKKNLNEVVDLSLLKHFNDILVEYETVNRPIFQSYIQLFSSNSFREAVLKRIDYCKEML